MSIWGFVLVTHLNEYIDVTCGTRWKRLHRPGRRSRYLLAPTRLHQVLPILDSSPLPILECLVLQPGKIVCDDLGRHIIECHRELAEIDSSNQEMFSRIAE